MYILFLNGGGDGSNQVYILHQKSIIYYLQIHTIKQESESKLVSLDLGDYL